MPPEWETLEEITPKGLRLLIQQCALWAWEEVPEGDRERMKDANGVIEAIENGEDPRPFDAEARVHPVRSVQHARKAIGRASRSTGETGAEVLRGDAKGVLAEWIESIRARAGNAAGATEGEAIAKAEAMIAELRGQGL
jgi:hypothetical protein